MPFMERALVNRVNHTAHCASQVSLSIVHYRVLVVLSLQDLAQLLALHVCVSVILVNEVTDARKRVISCVVQGSQALNFVVLGLYCSSERLAGGRSFVFDWGHAH